MLFQCLQDHTQQTLYFCLISLLRNNISNSVYINFRHFVFTITYRAVVTGAITLLHTLNFKYGRLSIVWRQTVTGISGPLIWSKTLMELMFNPYGEFR